MSCSKKIAITFIIILTLYTGLYFDLFCRYNILTSYFDLLKGDLIYPQCEFGGDRLKHLNSISNELGYKIVLVDCELFNTKGMDDYYKIMTIKIGNLNGQDWLTQLYNKIE
jgi:hypothetical protein